MQGSNCATRFFRTHVWLVSSGPANETRRVSRLRFEVVKEMVQLDIGDRRLVVANNAGTMRSKSRQT